MKTSKRKLLIREYLSGLGRKGGSSTSEAKRASSARNAAKATAAWVAKKKGTK